MTSTNISTGAHTAQNDAGYTVDAATATSNGVSEDVNGTSTIAPAPETSVPLLHQYAQQGDLERVRALLDDQDGNVKATDVDSEGITALHWAAMNSAMDVCRLLLERGADVDAVGGELHATPLHWATR